MAVCKAKRRIATQAKVKKEAKIIKLELNGLITVFDETNQRI